jgi:SAM-dependent methyltransferase
MAQIHEEEIAPLWDQRFAALLRAGLPALAAGEAATGDSRLTGAVLELGCGAGALTADLAQRHDGQGRLVAVDASSELLDRARDAVAGLPGARVFFRQHEPGARLPFAEETFDLVLAHEGFPGKEAPDKALRELCRLAAPGGQVMAVLPLAGTWAEVLDLMDEVLVELGENEARRALAAHRAQQLDGARLVEVAERAGLVDVEVELARWELVFRTGRELLYAPLVETGPLPGWKAVAGRATDMNAVFVALNDTIDTYSGRAGFSVSVVAGRISGRKQTEGTRA